jgi:hypothetical protein
MSVMVTLTLIVPDKTEEVRKLGMGRLLADLSRKLQHKADEPSSDQLRIAVHSTHDTGLAALASTLDVFDEKCVICMLYMAVSLTSAQVACVHICNYVRAVPP